MSKEITITDDLYEKLASLAEGFDTPANVIERLVEFYEYNSGVDSNNVTVSLKIDFEPEDEDEFKAKLLETRHADIEIFYNNKPSKIVHWNALKITEKSNIRGNLLTGRLRGWQNNGITGAKVTISTPKDIGELKIGKYVQNTFEELFSKDLLDVDVIQKLKDKVYCKEEFKQSFPILLETQNLDDRFDSTRRARYWKKLYFGRFLLCSQWSESHREYFNRWLLNMELSAKLK